MNPLSLFQAHRKLIRKPHSTTDFLILKLANNLRKGYLKDLDDFQNLVNILVSCKYVNEQPNHQTCHQILNISCQCAVCFLHPDVVEMPLG